MLNRKESPHPMETKRNLTRAWKMVLVALVGVAMVACGGSDDDASAGSGTESTAPASTASASDNDPAGSDDDSDGRDDDPAEITNLKALAVGVRVAVQAERAEVEGDTIHVYSKEGAAAMDPKTQCLLAAQVIPEATKVVIHKGGTETPC